MQTYTLPLFAIVLNEHQSRPNVQYQKTWRPKSCLNIHLKDSDYFPQSWKFTCIIPGVFKFKIEVCQLLKIEWDYFYHSLERDGESYPLFKFAILDPNIRLHSESPW